MKFEKYQKLERFGRPAVRGIEDGVCYVFPKLDGTNAQVFMDEDGWVHAGSRNRQLSYDKDNAGFYKFIQDNEAIKSYLETYPSHRLVGEFLVPHQIKTYKEDAWRRFYVFDVIVDSGEDERYLTYDEYQPLLEEFGLDYIPLLTLVENGTPKEFNELANNDYLIKDGEGSGEGIVVKRYNFVNSFGRQVWAKVINREFTVNKKTRVKSDNVSQQLIEDKIVNKFCTEEFIKKEYSKIENEHGGFEGENIPELLGRVWHEFLIEETYNFVKEFRDPEVNFSKLRVSLIDKIKDTLPEVF